MFAPKLYEQVMINCTNDSTWKRRKNKQLKKTGSLLV